MSRRPSPASLWASLGSVICGTAVLAGAYGWHRLAADEDLRDIFMLATQYQMWHGLALFAVAWAAAPHERFVGFAGAAGAAFCLGTILFSVNIYAFAVRGDYLLPGTAPLGGFALMAGWALLAVAALRRRAPGNNGSFASKNQVR